MIKKLLLSIFLCAISGMLCASQKPKQFDLKVFNETTAQLKKELAISKAQNIVHGIQMIQMFKTRRAKLEQLTDPLFDFTKEIATLTQEISALEVQRDQLVAEINFDPHLLVEYASTQDESTIPDVFYILFELENKELFTPSLKTVELALRHSTAKVVQEILNSHFLNEQSELLNTQKLKALRERALKEKWCSKLLIMPHLIAHINKLEKKNGVQQSVNRVSQVQRADTKVKREKEAEHQSEQKPSSLFPQLRLNAHAKPFAPKK